MRINTEAEYNSACDRIAELYEAAASIDAPEEIIKEWTVLTLAVQDYEQKEADKVEAMFAGL